MIRYKLTFLLLIIGVHCFSQKSNTKRFALVIGVQSYTSVPPLKNSLKDARDLSAELKKRGFQVIESYDPKGKKDMQASVRAYFDKIQSDPSIEGLFYYSGHAMQVDGINYLMPANSNPALKADLDDQCLKMDYVLDVFAQAGNTLNIIIMDACRNNPFRGFSRSADQGLSQIYPPKGSYLVYATSPGSVASDGDGSNGLFTSKLLKYIKEPDLNLEQMFKLVAREVQKESGDRQLPWINSSYTGDFYFNKKSFSNEPAIVKEEVNSQPSKADSRNFVPSSSNIKSTKIDTREWMSENLDVTHYRNGDEIPQVQDPKEWSKLTTGAWCYYENKSENGTKFGKLYNWYAVNDSRGLAPIGFHVPTEEEWKNLEIYLSNEPGKKLKGTTGWFDNGNGTNEYGFNAQASGFRYGTGVFSLLGKSGYWWSSTESNPQSIKVKTISFRGFSLSDAILSTTSGISVRCVKD